MTMRESTHAGRQTARSAFSLIEVLVSLLLISGLFLSAVNTVGAAKMSQFRVHESTVGNLLAQGLMTEILDQNYEEPVDVVLFGRERTEDALTRRNYDDVDDYFSWGPTYPERSGGTPIPGFTGWVRSAVVDWVDPINLANPSVTPTGVKRVTVSAFHNGDLVTTLVAIRTDGPPPPPPGLAVLLIVTDVTNLTIQETARITLLESWGHAVTLIAASEPGANFSAAIANQDVVYRISGVDAPQFAIELRNASIGVILEDPQMATDLGFSSGSKEINATDIRIDDNRHQITAGLATGPLTVVTTPQLLWAIDGVASVDLTIVARINSAGPTYLPALSVLDSNANLFGGGTAKGRRVALPWGGTTFDINTLTPAGQELLKQALKWAALNSSINSIPAPLLIQ